MERSCGKGEGKAGLAENQSVQEWLASVDFWDTTMVSTCQAGNLDRGDHINEGIPLSALTHSSPTEAEKKDERWRTIYGGTPYACLTAYEREDRAWRALVQEGKDEEEWQQSKWEK